MRLTPEQVSKPRATMVSGANLEVEVWIVDIRIAQLTKEVLA